MCVTHSLYRREGGVDGVIGYMTIERAWTALMSMYVHVNVWIRRTRTSGAEREGPAPAPAPAAGWNEVDRCTEGAQCVCEQTDRPTKERRNETQRREAEAKPSQAERSGGDCFLLLFSSVSLDARWLFVWLWFVLLGRKGDTYPPVAPAPTWESAGAVVAGDGSGEESLDGTGLSPSSAGTRSSPRSCGGGIRKLTVGGWACASAEEASYASS